MRDGSGLRWAVLLLTGTTFLAMTPPTAHADGLAVIRHVDFDDDTPGEPPATGGAGQPTSLFTEDGTSILVQESANGIDTQPVVLTAEAGNQYVSVDTTFPPVSQGLVRVEATAAFDAYTDGYFLQTSVEASTAIFTRLRVTESGEIESNLERVTVGTYSPNVPFRARMDIDLTAHVWSVAIDDEMNGFEDDPVTADLPLENDLEDLPYLSAVGASFQRTFTFSGPASVAYDDIEVWVDTITVGVEGAGSGEISVNPGSHGLIALTIPSTSTFDATTIVVSSVRFGTASPNDSRQRDADGDGDVDLVLRFRSDETGIECGDMSAPLTGATSAGVQIQGTVSIRTQGC